MYVHMLENKNAKSNCSLLTNHCSSIPRAAAPPWLTPLHYIYMVSHGVWNIPLVNFDQLPWSFPVPSQPLVYRANFLNFTTFILYLTCEDFRSSCMVSTTWNHSSRLLLQSLSMGYAFFKPHPLLPRGLFCGCMWKSALSGVCGLQEDGLLHDGPLLGCRELLLQPGAPPAVTLEAEGTILTPLSQLLLQTNIPFLKPVLLEHTYCCSRLTSGCSGSLLEKLKLALLWHASIAWMFSHQSPLKPLWTQNFAM